MSQWADKVKRAKKYWEPIFNRMKADQDFAAGYQWSKEEKDDRYTANLTLRIIAQRVAFFYAKNPKFEAFRRQRILNTVWDNEQTTLVVAPAIRRRDLAASRDGRDGPGDGAAGASRRRCPSCKTPPASSRRKSSSARSGKRLNFCSGPTSTPRRKTSSR